MLYSLENSQAFLSLTTCLVLIALSNCNSGYAQKSMSNPLLIYSLSRLDHLMKAYRCLIQLLLIKIELAQITEKGNGKSLIVDLARDFQAFLPVLFRFPVILSTRG